MSMPMSVVVAVVTVRPMHMGLVGIGLVMGLVLVCMAVVVMPM